MRFGSHLGNGFFLGDEPFWRGLLSSSLGVDGSLDLEREVGWGYIYIYISPGKEAWIWPGIKGIRNECCSLLNSGVGQGRRARDYLMGKVNPRRVEVGPVEVPTKSKGGLFETPGPRRPATKECWSPPGTVSPPTSMSHFPPFLPNLLPSQAAGDPLLTVISFGERTCPTYYAYPGGCCLQVWSLKRLEARE